MYSYLSHLECTGCGKAYPCDQLSTVSSCCGNVLFARYDLHRLRQEVDRDALTQRNPNMWRFSELLPVKDPRNVISLGEGGTPLLEATRLGKDLGLGRLFIKEEGLNPTGTFKARGISAAVSRSKDARPNPQLSWRSSISSSRPVSKVCGNPTHAFTRLPVSGWV